jgi:heme/copper-type cytochrome/quinol oxidase subunit 2
MKIFSLSFLKYLTIIPVFFFVFALSVPHLHAGVDQVTLQNPLNGINSIEALLVAILNIVMILMVPVIVFFIIYAGFKYVMAQGNASQVEEATRALTYAVIGGVLILAALAITEIIRNVVAAFQAP